MLYRLLAIALVMLVSLGSHPAGGHAGAAAAPLANELEQRYPRSLTFRLKTQPGVTIKSLALLYRTDSLKCYEGDVRQAVEVDASTPGQAAWEMDLRYGATLPPGAKLTWRWEIVDKSGNVTQTPEQSALIDDANYTWRAATRAGVTMHWSQGEASFGELLLGLAERNLKTAAARMNVQPGRDIHIWIYPSTEALRKTLIFGPEWTGGVALPDHNAIMIGIAPGQTSWARTVIPHELTHLLVRARLFNCRGGELPTWLDEGLAVQAEPSLNAHGELAEIVAALKSGDIGTLRSLGNGFAADPRIATLSYALSGRVASFLIGKGPDKLLALLDRVQAGDNIDDALLAVYGFDTDGLDRAWRASIGLKQPAAAAATATVKAPTRKRTPVPTLALWTAVPATPRATPKP